MVINIFPPVSRPPVYVQDATPSPQPTAAAFWLDTDDVGTPVFDQSSPLASGTSTFPRGELDRYAGAFGSASGRLMLTYFTATKSFTASSIRIYTGGSGTTTPTLIRMGLYSVDVSDNATLIASTPNDTALFASGLTAYTKAFSATVPIIAGNRYAIGILQVAASTALLTGHSVPVNDCSAANDFSQVPRITGLIESQSDLPSTLTSASLSFSSGIHYAAIIP